MNMGTIGGWQFAMSLVSMQLSCEERMVIEEMRRTAIPSILNSAASKKVMLQLPTPLDVLRIAQTVDSNIQNFRSKQLDVIMNILSGTHTVTVMATSSGKTLIWLLAGHILSSHFSSKDECGLTIIICPLSSLVSEHAKNSPKWGATCSSCDELQIFKVTIRKAVFLYTTAEKLQKNMYFRGLVLEQAHRVVNIVRDEAHIWMDDFRPALCEVSAMLSQEIPNVTHLAVTATLDVSADIINSLGMPPTSSIIRCSVNRENCFLHVIEGRDKKGKYENDAKTILSKVNSVERPQALVFVTSQKDAQAMAVAIQSAIGAEDLYLSKEEVHFYHAALPNEQKLLIAQNFRVGVSRIVVCTSAFGTGLDFPSIRLIFHRTIPTSVSEYLQNIGRGGRDGLPYQCFLFFSYKLIHECASVWMTAEHYSQEQLQKKWKEFVAMVKYPMSTLCRRAYLLPMFDPDFNASSACNKCDNCVREISGCDMLCDITKAAHIIIKVVQESVKYEANGLTISRIRDIILALNPRTAKGETALTQLDKDHAHRGVGLKAGFSSKDRYLWSMLSTYLMYAMEPPLLIESVSCISGQGFRALSRMVRVTPDGASTLLYQRQVRLRYPIDLMRLEEPAVLSLLNGAKHSIDVTPTHRVCVFEECTETIIHAKGLCRKHYQRTYMQQHRKTPNSASSGGGTPMPFSRGVTPVDGISASKQELRFLTDESRDPFLSRPGSQVAEGAETCSLPLATFKSLSQGSDIGTAAAVVSASALLSSPPAISTDSSQESFNYATSESSDDDVETLMSANEATKQCILDGQFLPGSIAPAEAKTEVHKFTPEDAATWCLGWAKLGYTSSCLGRSTKKYKCLGCWHCPDSKCPYRARPHTKKRDTPRCGNMVHHAGNCPDLILRGCSVRFEYSVELPSRCTTLTVTGVHNHGIPPPNRVGPETLKHLAQIVKEGDARPTATSLQLGSQVVQADAGSSEARRLGREIAAAYATVYGSDLGIGGLNDIRKVIGDDPFVRHVQVGNADDGYTNVVFCQLTEQQKLVASIAEAFTNESEATDSHCATPTTASLFCDVTYKFSNYYKMTFMTESNITGKGITVAFVLVTNLTSEAYMRMFYLLFTKNPSIYRRNLEARVIDLLFDVCIVDFADSQRKGFIQAVLRLHREAFGASAPFDENRHLAKLKGCKFHWKQSVKHCSHNGHVVPDTLRHDFASLALQMETASTMNDFNDAVHMMERKFPGARTWLKWWTNVLHGVLIFPAMRSHHLYEEIEDFYKKPATNNIVEANNRATARFIDYAHLPVVLAVRKCFLWAQLEVRQVQQITEGILRVGAGRKTKLTERIQHSGGAFRQASRTAVRNEEYENGNRAPVSTLEFSMTSASQSAIGSRKRAKVVIVPPGSSAEQASGVEVLRNNIRSNGLPPNSIVQVLNLQDNDKW
jgi:superfamily II DNA helicase RecQ